MIRVQNLVKEYGDNRAVDDVSFEIYPGQICAYLGPNGAGKSTTVKILTGVLKPTSGQVSVANFQVDQDPVEVKRRIGYVPENAHLYPTLSVAEYLALIGTFHQIDPAEVAERGQQMLDVFDIPKAIDQRIGTLSKGMRQKVLITGAMIHDPEVLLLDEPLSGLDANATEAVKKIIREMAGRGKTILYCSHLLDIVERLCERVIILNQGQVIINDEPKNVIKNAAASTLEEAFRKLTGGADVDQKASDFANIVRNNVE